MHARHYPQLLRRGRVVLALTLALAYLSHPAALPARAAGVIYVTPGGTGDGSAWAQGIDLAAALRAAVSGDQIWVSAGTYRPGAARSDSFVLKSGVAIYGGFAGGEMRLDQRDWAANVVTLSGDLRGDDGPGFQSYGENSYHVVIGASGATLDGVTISGGNANGALPDDRGGGVFNFDQSPTLSNIIITGNRATSHGGGVANENSSVTMTNVEISGNQASNGGGMANNHSDAKLTNATISDNSASRGGGLYFYYSASILTNVHLSGNHASSDGGGMAANGSRHSLIDVNVENNSASSGGGLYFVNSDAALLNANISGNQASFSGGGIYHGVSYTMLSLVNTTLSGNSAKIGGGIYDWYNYLALTNCTLSGNMASESGGGIFRDEPLSGTLYNSVLWGNTAPSGPEIFSAYYAGSGSAPSFTSSLIAGSGGSGAGWDSALGSDGGGNLDADPLFVSPVPAAPSTGGDLRLQAGSPAVDAGSNALLPADSRDLDHDGDVGEPIPLDYAGNPRVVGSAVDMGAYEYFRVRYVRAGASGADDGSSWADAYPDLATALSTTSNGDVIWVAAGTYRPTTLDPDPRMATFQLKSGLPIYGGFAGTETRLGERDWTANIVTLSGDIGAPGDLSDNSYHVVTGADAATLDGVTISGGNADGAAPHDAGGGMFIGAGSPTLANVTISANRAARGGGMSIGSSSPTLTNVTVSANRASDGGGVLISAGSPTLINVTISGNDTPGNGGGILSASSSLTLTNVILSGNRAAGSGGGMFSVSSGGKFTNITISGNRSADGGAMMTQSCKPGQLMIYSTIIWDNGAQSLSSSDCTPYIYHSLTDGDPQFVSPVPAAPSTAGDLHLRSSSPAINAGYDQAALTPTDRDGSPRIVGGAIDMGAYESPFLSRIYTVYLPIAGT